MATTPASESTSTIAASPRLLSIDALRGFDMFWIIGGRHLVSPLAEWGDWRFKEQIDEQLTHVPWEGFHFYDLIFPLFLFLVGAVFFIVIGCNAIVVYVAPKFVNFDYTARFLFGGLIKHAGSFEPVAKAISVLAVKWLILLYLFRKKLFLRV